MDIPDDLNVRIISEDSEFRLVEEDDSMEKRMRAASRQVVGKHSVMKDSELVEAPALFELDVSADRCPGCGAKFQDKFEDRSGYVPTHVLARTKDDSPEVEVAQLLSEIEFVEEEEEDEGSDVVCMRCHSLRHRSRTDLRASLDGKDEELSAFAFEKLLRDEVREARGVVILFVDLFDTDASLKAWSSLGSLVGSDKKTRKKLLVAANKVDLLPKDISRLRVKLWVRSAVEKTIPSIDLHPDDVFLLSAMKGAGVQELLRVSKLEAARRKGNVYVCGAANVGKSTFLNRAIGAFVKKTKYSKKGKNKPMLTASTTPGTTLGIVRVASKGPGEPALHDTPGLLSPFSLSVWLDSQELDAVMPKKQLKPKTLSVDPGSSVHVGGLCKVTLGESQYGSMLLTFFVDDSVVLHPTKNKNFDVEARVGDLLKPPFDVERYRTLRSNSTTTTFAVEGRGFDEAAIDVVLSGIGWFSVTGSGDCAVEVDGPANMLVTTRQPLLPFEAKYNTAKYTGGKLVAPRRKLSKYKKTKRK